MRTLHPNIQVLSIILAYLSIFAYIRELQGTELFAFPQMYNLCFPSWESLLLRFISLKCHWPYLLKGYLSFHVQFKSCHLPGTYRDSSLFLHSHHPFSSSFLSSLCNFYRTYFILPYIMVICVFVFLYLICKFVKYRKCVLLFFKYPIVPCTSQVFDTCLSSWIQIEEEKCLF